MGGNGGGEGENHIHRKRHIAYYEPCRKVVRENRFQLFL